MSTRSIEKNVIRIVADVLGLHPDVVFRDSHLYTDFYADALTVAEIVLQVEDRFGISIKMQEAESFQTVADLIRYVDCSASRTGLSVGNRFLHRHRFALFFFLAGLCLILTALLLPWVLQLDVRGRLGQGRARHWWDIAFVVGLLACLIGARGLSVAVVKEYGHLNLPSWVSIILLVLLLGFLGTMAILYFL